MCSKASFGRMMGAVGAGHRFRLLWARETLLQALSCPVLVRRERTWKAVTTVQGRLGRGQEGPSLSREG